MAPLVPTLLKDKNGNSLYTLNTNEVSMATYDDLNRYIGAI